MKPKQKRLLARKKQEEAAKASAPEVVEEAVETTVAPEPKAEDAPKKASSKMPRVK